MILFVFDAYLCVFTIPISISTVSQYFNDLPLFDYTHTTSTSLDLSGTFFKLCFFRLLFVHDYDHHYHNYFHYKFLSFFANFAKLFVVSSCSFGLLN